MAKMRYPSVREASRKAFILMDVDPDSTDFHPSQEDAVFDLWASGYAEGWNAAIASGATEPKDIGKE